MTVLLSTLVAVFYIRKVINRSWLPFLLVVVKHARLWLCFLLVCTICPETMLLVLIF